MARGKGGPQRSTTIVSDIVTVKLFSRISLDPEAKEISVGELLKQRKT